MPTPRRSSSDETFLPDENRPTVVFPLADSDKTLAIEIEKNLKRYFSEIGVDDRRRQVVLMSGWLPQPSGEQFQRIREFGEALKQIPNLCLWIISAEKSADDIRRFAPSPLYITGRLMSAGIPIFEPEQGKHGVEKSMKRMHPEAVKAWLDMLSSIGPGVTDLTHWRHDIRGRILGTINLNLQMADEDFTERLLSDAMGSTLALWSDLAATQPYCDQYPKIKETANLLFKIVEDYRTNRAYNVAEARRAMSLAADALEKTLDESRDLARKA